ncbi:uncharacterized protein LTR77_008203 [Saxophila tyrrhenica]|uniref:Ubiquitin-like domain-containing protein n=1 Tax=Saxophila tyrrhenica TaxID=1690608 RepID=A0AAV9P670_9PEZI|nr:hypothetical protein LTR77_008203 [Saxophila tyrrhenica]
MAPAQPPETITLKVKVPPGHLTLPAISGEGSTTVSQDSYDLGSLPVSTTVGALRQQIQSAIPSNPAPERQRLLYGGRALVNNDQTLADAFNTKRDASQTDYVIHLLVGGAGMSSGPRGHQASRSTSAVEGMGGARDARTSPVPGQQPAPHAGAQGPQGLGTMRQAAERLRAQMPPHLRERAQTGQANGAPPFPMPGMPGQPPMMGGAMPPGMGLPPGFPMPPHMPTPGQQQPQPNGQTPSRTDGNQTPAEAPQGAQNQGNIPAGQQPQQHGNRRPVSGQGFHVQGVGPNGQRFEIHQQTLNFPHMTQGQPGQAMQMPMPFGMPQMQPGMPPPQPPRQPNGPSALERARENMTEMRRMLEEMRNQTDAPSEEERRRRIDEMEQRVIGVNNYIDPLNAIPTATPTTTGGADATGRRSAPPNTGAPPFLQPPMFMNRPPQFQAMAQAPRLNGPSVQGQSPSPRNPSDVTAYLLSGPQGPQALLFSPQHGMFQGSLPRASPTPTATTTQPTPTQQPQQGHQQHQPRGIPLPDAGALAQQAQAQAGEANQAAAAPDPLGPLQPILAHVWLLLRILIFAYFLLGTNMGYTRPLVLAGIGMVFWAIRMGALGDGAAVRRWWEGVLGGEGRPEPRGQAANEQAHGQAQAGGQHRMPTPEQVAQRLLHEEAERDRARGGRGWLREQVRPVERAAALFVASLWPGIGEAHVREQRRAREEADAERRRVEGEEAERRREAEEREKGTEGSKESAEGGAERSGSGGVAAEAGESARATTSGNAVGEEGSGST